MGTLSSILRQTVVELAGSWEVCFGDAPPQSLLAAAAATAALPST